MMLAGRYRLDMPLGRGGMGEVWMAVDEWLDRPVAVKLLAESAMGDDRSATRFRREARIAARLNHPRIVTVYDFGVSEGQCFLTMELVNGSSLAHELRRRGPLGAARVAAIAAQAAEGLAEAHRQGVVHRDVKPANLLLDEEGMVKVADFGVARCPASETTPSTPDDGLITGTTLYLAPEAALGGKAEAAGDVYALGCSLYELLAGKPPFTGDHPVAVMCQHVETPPVAPCRVCPGLPEAFGDILLRMLAKAPGERPTATEVAEWFGTVRERAADRVIGEGSGPQETAVTVRRADPVPRTAVTSAVTSAVASAEVAPARRRRRGPMVAGAVTAAAALAAAAVVLTTPLGDAAPHGHASGAGPHSSLPATGPSGEQGVGLPGPGARTGAGQGQASGRPVPASLTSDHDAAGSAAPVPLAVTTAGPSREPTTAPTRTPTPTASTSAPASPSAPPTSASPSPSGTPSPQATVGSGTALRGGRGD